MASIVPYKIEGCFAVIGNTYAIKDKLKEYGCKFNKFLSIEDKKIPGWLFYKENENYDNIKNVVSGAPEKKVFINKKSKHQEDQFYYDDDQDTHLKDNLILNKPVSEKKTFYKLISPEEDNEFKMFDKLFPYKDNETEKKMMPAIGEHLYNHVLDTFLKYNLYVLKRDDHHIIKGQYLLLFCKHFAKIFEKVKTTKTYNNYGLVESIIINKEDYNDFFEAFY